MPPSSPSCIHSRLGILLNKDVGACRVEEPWLWAWRGLANYVVPKIDVQVSAIMRSQPNVLATNDPGSNGLSQSANYFEQAANVVAQLGRPVAGNAPQVTLDLARLGDVYPDRLNTVDMRVSKILRIRRIRANVGFDLYNLFNANTGTSFNQNFGTDGSTWLRPNAHPEPAVCTLQRDGRFLDRTRHCRESKHEGPRCEAARPLNLVAGAGCEPATFGL